MRCDWLISWNLHRNGFELNLFAIAVFPMRSPRSHLTLKEYLKATSPLLQKISLGRPFEMKCREYSLSMRSASWEQPSHFTRFANALNECLFRESQRRQKRSQGQFRAAHRHLQPQCTYNRFPASFYGLCTHSQSSSSSTPCFVRPLPLQNGRHCTGSCTHRQLGTNFSQLFLRDQEHFQTLHRKTLSPTRKRLK